MGCKSRVEFIARIIDGDGHVVERTVSSSIEFPSSDSFNLSTRESFLSDFAVFEQAVLEARNKAGAEVASEYLEIASKKTKMRKQQKSKHQ